MRQRRIFIKGGLTGDFNFDTSSRRDHQALSNHQNVYGFLSMDHRIVAGTGFFLRFA